MSSRKILSPVIDEAWSQYHEYRLLSFVVNPSIPILFFGDYFRYSASSLRIITVGLNPSSREFPSDNPFSRFPQATSFSKGSIIHEDYVQSLSDYYKKVPYMGWFKCYEPILNGMEGSYSDTKKNTVLHTDICTPLATNPTWSGLQKQEKFLTQELEKKGFALWYKLISALEPDIIILSVAKRYKEKIKTTQPWEPLYTIDRKHPYVVEKAWMELPSGKKTMLIFGKAAQKPFGTVADKKKPGIGQKIRTCYTTDIRKV